MSKIRILAIPSDTHGVGKYRVLDPYKYIGDVMSDDIHVDIAFDVENKDSSFDNYDIVVFHSFIHKGSHELTVNRIKWLKTNGIITIMDTDDFWRVDKRHPNYDGIVKSKMPERRVELLKLSDHVTTTTTLYQDQLKKLLGLKSVHVFPNAVDETESQFQPKPTESDKVRFGWLGGSSHYHDVNLLSGGINQIHSSYRGKVQFVLCGFDTRGNMNVVNPLTGEVRQRPIRPEETVWKQYEQIFTNNYREIDENYVSYLNKYDSENVYEDVESLPYVRRWTMDINKYANNYNLFDVSLAPLVESEFNKMKSQLKVIEAGFHKKAIIATDFGPYTIDLVSAIQKGGDVDPNGNSLLVSSSKNHKQWFQHMKRLIDNPNMVTDLGEKLYETVKDKYSLSTVSKNRVEFFKTIINK
jgi:glycosyltransferase involved in cell wall biosynthesis